MLVASGVTAALMGDEMLRVHFSDADLALVRVAATTDPLWDIATSLHRLQTHQGRSSFEGWIASARARLRERGLERAVRQILLPLFPRALYFPDFLTPAEGAAGLAHGLEAVAATPRHRVLREMARLDRVVGAPSWAPRLAERGTREELTRVLGAYHEAVIAPYGDRIQAGIDAERTAHCRRLLDGGVRGMLTGLSPAMRWDHPVLHVNYPGSDRDLYLGGRGLILAPSYFCWRDPVTLADPGLPPVLMYPLLRPSRTSSALDGLVGDTPGPLAVLLGRTRARVLSVIACGATTSEIARATGVAVSSASKHASALREAGLVNSSRQAASVLHTLTPVGTAVLAASRAAAHG